MPKILLCHIPLIPLRQDDVLSRSFTYNSYFARDPELLQIVDDNADTVIAVLSGHLHLTGMVQRKGVYHMSLSGTNEFPCDYGLFEVYPDRIRVKVLSLPEKFIPEKRNFHGRPRLSIDHTDDLHRSFDLYVKGRPQERDFIIPLKDRKRPSAD